MLMRKGRGPFMVVARGLLAVLRGVGLFAAVVIVASVVIAGGALAFHGVDLVFRAIP